MENYETNMDFVCLFRVYVVREQFGTAKIEYEFVVNVD